MDEQPLPLPCPGVEGAHDLLVKDLALAGLPDVLYKEATTRVVDRRDYGLELYGQLLCPDDGRDTLRDAMEEALDLCVYLRNLLRLGHQLHGAYDASVCIYLDLVMEQTGLRDLDMSSFRGITKLAPESREGSGL